MAITTLLDGRNSRAWELDPSTRESVHLLTKPYPVDSTLAVAGTAEDLLNVQTLRGMLPTVNLVTNPSCETGTPPTGYAAVASATLAQDGTYYNYGSYSLKITPPDAVRGEGVYWDLGDVSYNTPLGLSAYLTRGVGAGSDARVELVASTVTGYSAYTDIRLQLGNTITLSTAWQRSQLFSVDREIIIFHISSASGTFDEDETVTGGTTAATATVMTDGGGTWLAVTAPSAQFSAELGLYATETITGATSGETATLTRIERIKVSGTLHLYIVTATKHGTVFYADGIQAEVNDCVTDYCDGDQGIYTWWDGTAHASTSRRWRKLSCIRSMRLHATRDCYVALDRAADSTAANAQDRGEYIRAGTDWGEDHPIYLDEKMSFVNRLTGEQPRIYGMIWGT